MTTKKFNDQFTLELSDSDNDTPTNQNSNEQQEKVNDVAVCTDFDEDSQSSLESICRSDSSSVAGDISNSSGQFKKKRSAQRTAKCCKKKFRI
jgi:hypothetical protein